MKIALYIEDGLEQIVLTPQTDTERGILGKLHDGTREMSLKKGSFYACNGGWTRHESAYSERVGESTMIVLRKQETSNA